jgi:hypothetical protein
VPPEKMVWKPLLTSAPSTSAPEKMSWTPPLKMVPLMVALARTSR